MTYVCSKKMAAEEKDRPNWSSSYRVRRSIGKGSYGEVFLVTYRGDGKQVGSPAEVCLVLAAPAVRDEEHKTHC